MHVAVFELLTSISFENKCKTLAQHHKSYLYLHSNNINRSPGHFDVQITKSQISCLLGEYLTLLINQPAFLRKELRSHLQRTHIILCSLRTSTDLLNYDLFLFFLRFQNHFLDNDGFTHSHVKLYVIVHVYSLYA